MTNTLRTATLTLHFDQPLGPLEIDRIALGQGGQSADRVLESRVAEIRALHPRLVRFWLQEYFNPLPKPGVYHFEEIDYQIDLVLKTGATPLLSLNFKPAVLFPQIDERVIDPVDYAAWEAFITALVQRYVDRGLSGWYWEIIGESDCGEGGGCPYLATPETYPPFYARTAAAILRADPTARVGGPGLGYHRSPVLPALLAACAAQDVPLHFVSWHGYNSDPGFFRASINDVRELLSHYPDLHPETILDEWNMDLQPDAAARDPRFQPCFILETAWQMKEAGLDYACYYQIRDYHVDLDAFARFFSPGGAAFMARWWNRMPQYGGLFDYQDTVRPAYFSFKLLSRLVGQRLRLDSDDPQVHGFVTYDPVYQLYCLLLWNFSAEPVQVVLDLVALPEDLVALSFVLDATTASNDENHRIRQRDKLPLAGDSPLAVACAPYGVHFWYLMCDRWSIDGMG